MQKSNFADALNKLDFHAAALIKEQNEKIRLIFDNQLKEFLNSFNYTFISTTFGREENNIPFYNVVVSDNNEILVDFKVICNRKLYSNEALNDVKYFIIHQIEKE